MKQDRFLYLINQYVNKTISVAETTELRELLTEMERPELTEALGEAWLTADRPAFQEEEGDKRMQDRIAAIVAVDKGQDENDIDNEDNEGKRNDRRFFVGRRVWLRYAAAAVLILGVGGTAWFRFADRNASRTAVQVAKTQDIEPGRQTAVLTLADGTRLSLDSAVNGVVATQGNAAVTKLASGQIVYRPNGTGKGKPLMNTMATPRGGQYQLVLPDGTKVWLNAASAITYPVAFDGERKVEVTGEAYFEVAKNKEPFIVDIAGRSSIEVLGTDFNVNAYPDEKSMTTTLVEGKIKVGKSVILRPGQQAVGANEITVVDHADLEQVLAWKNGLISLENVDFSDLMLQLERWYDIRVRYEGAVPIIKFKGEMDRGVRLSGVLRFLMNFGIRTRLEGKTLVILESDPSK